MNNCLVTKLKSTVNNEDLSKLNVLTIKVKASDSPTADSQFIGFSTSENGTSSINTSSVGLHKREISGELYPLPITVPANSNFSGYADNKDGIVEITGKYNLITLSLGYNTVVRAREIYGMSANSIRFIIIGNFEENEIDANKLDRVIDHNRLTDFVYYGRLNPLNVINKFDPKTVGKFTALEKVSGGFCSLFTSLGVDDLVDNVSIKQIYFYNSNLKQGSLSSFAKLTKLELIQFMDYAQNTGDIMDFINPWIQAGRTNGKIMVNWLLGQKNITLNGQPITYPEGVQNNKAYLNWTSDGTVTFTAS